jgi:uncharacterized protein YeaO (DUF488 family)
VVDGRWVLGENGMSGQPEVRVRRVYDEPSTELRRWYGHDPSKFDQFRRRYQAELAEPERQAGLRHLRELARSGRLTLVTATRDIDLSQAAVLAEHLRTMT